MINRLQPDALVQLEPHATDSPWAGLARLMGSDTRVLLLFGVLYLALAACGPFFRDPAEGLLVMWPAGGLLFAALWLANRRHWVWIILIQVASELLVRTMQTGMAPAAGAIEALLHTLVGLVSAVTLRRMLGGLQWLRLVAVLRFMFAAGVGALVGALAWFGIVQAGQPPAAIVHRVLLTGLADLLGALVLVPPVMGWLLARHFRGFLSLRSRWQVPEILLLLVIQVAIVVYIFGSGGANAADQLRFPALAVPGLIYGAFRLPPRWSTVVMSVTVLIMLAMTAHGGNPFGIDSTTARFIWIQVSCGSFCIAGVALTVYVAQSRIAVGSLASSEARYRSFIAMSSEAVWRVEVDPPMPVDLPLPRQVEWLRERARVVESSESYAQLCTDDGQAQQDRWSRGSAWVPAFEAELEQMQKQGYRAHDIRIAVPAANRERSFLVSFDGVVRDGRLERVWGLAREVTELQELNARLMREQETLRAYARRITSAEESTRHSTAVDLHNGIGQELIAMGMRLTVLGNQLPPEQRSHLDELRGNLHKVQQYTRDLISGLSPPGLYDLGLVPALQWLVVYLRGRDKLVVELDAELDEQAVPTELRVLVFKMVRELLRNVTRHAGVDRAEVRLRGDRTRLTVTVADAGNGFAWNPDSLVSPPRGFGLWSIASRVAEVGGRFAVDSAPGKGATFSLEIPLRRAAPTLPEQRFPSASRSAS